MLSKQPYYHGTIRKCLVAFGALFTNIQIERTDKEGVVQKVIEVPISYGNKEKWLARINEDPNLDKRVLVSLPRIGFELTDFQYDGSRKLNKMGQLRSDDPSAVGTVATMYTPVPWNLGFNVYILTKTQDDALRIIEQILPFFTPGYTVTINAVPDMGIKQDIPVILNGVSYEDNATDGPMEERREIKYTLSFTMKAELWGPKSDSNIILHTRTKLGTVKNLYERQHNSDVVGDPEGEYVIVDEWFDLEPTI
jgi:hypothetical protein